MIMHKISKSLLLVAAGVTLGTSTALVEQTPTVTYAATMSQENFDLANRDIADYLGNCQQYEQNDQTFKGFTSIKSIKYTKNNQIKVDVNDDIYQLPKARRTLLIQTLQNGVYGTLADNNLKKLSEKDIEKGCKTTVYLNGHVIGQSSTNDTRKISWNK